MVRMAWQKAEPVMWKSWALFSREQNCIQGLVNKKLDEMEKICYPIEM